MLYKKYLFNVLLFFIFWNVLANADVKVDVKPHFVSIKSSRMNTRVGPGFDYPILWHYWRKSMPVEIVESYDQWRKIRDINGDVSWAYQALLSGNRTVIIKEGIDKYAGNLPLYAAPSQDSRVLSTVEKGAIGKIIKCDGKWCEVSFGKVTGYLNENMLWGVYNNEVIK